MCRRSMLPVVDYINSVVYLYAVVYVWGHAPHVPTLDGEACRLRTQVSSAHT